MNGKQIKRKTKVVSVSLEPEVVLMLSKLAKINDQSRSALLASLIKRESLLSQLKELREIGRKYAKKLKITSDEDVYRIMGDA